MPHSNLPTSAPTSPRAAPGAVGYLLGVTGLAVAYYLTAEVGLSVPYIAGTVSLIWPPSGVAVAVLFRFGLRYWPGVFLAAVAAETGQGFGWAAVGIAVGNTLAPVAVVTLLRRLRFDRQFTSQRDVLRYVAAAALGILISATNGAAWVCLDSRAAWADYPDVWWVWWCGDAVGVLVFGTPVLTVPSRRDWFGHFGRRLKLAVGGVLLIVAATVTVGPLAGSFAHRFPVGIFVGLFVLWAGVRYGIWVGSVFVLAVAAVAVPSTAAGVGVFVRDDASAGLLTLWGFLAGLESLVLMMAAVTAERDRAVTRLALGEQMYRQLVEDNPAMIARLGPDLAVTFANETYARLAGRPAAELIGRPFLVDLDPFTRTRLAATVADLHPDEAPAAFEVLVPTAAGLRWEKWVIRALGPADGPPDGFHAVGLDVTDRKQAEEDRRVLEEKMYEAQKMESLGVLAGGVAHDFNNLLTVIVGNAELAAQSLPPESPAHPHLGQVGEAARRAADLTRQLLAYAGKGRLLARPIDLNAVVRSTADLMRGSLPAGCQVRFELGPNLPPVTADETQVRQVVMNLLLNAGEALGPERGTVTIRTNEQTITEDVTTGPEAGPPPGWYVRLAVTDSGCGMPPEVMARVFEPFFTTKFTGRGLGLAAVQGIVRAHGGAVTVASEPGRGSEFTVLLPVEPAPTDRPTNGHRPTALVIECRRDDRESVRQSLESLGWEVVTADRESAGVARFRTEPDRFGLVVWGMPRPDADPARVLGAIRSVRSDVPVLVAATYGQSSLPDLAAYNPAAFLLKPFAGADLEAAVRRVTAARVAGGKTAA